FEISIQLGAILAVVIIYFKRVWNNLGLIWKLAAAFIPTSIIGLIFYKIVKNFLMESNLVIAISLVLGGIIIILFENWYAKKNIPKVAEDKDLNAITYKQAVILGVVQALAIIPGVSRAGATIIGGLAQGIKRKTIVEFSFLLAIPTMLAATALDIYKNPTVFNGNQLTIWLIGFITSFITAIIGVKFLIKYVQKNDFKIFGWYRIVLGLIVLGIILL
ncbi:MAG: undecaprenyl-diphosphate phosphatase, partial [Patescibacteria group bacterium]